MQAFELILHKIKNFKAPHNGSYLWFQKRIWWRWLKILDVLTLLPFFLDSFLHPHAELKTCAFIFHISLSLSSLELSLTSLSRNQIMKEKNEWVIFILISYIHGKET